MFEDTRLAQELEDLICSEKLSDDDRGLVLAIVQGLCELVEDHGENALTAIAYFSAKYNAMVSAAAMEN